MNMRPFFLTMGAAILLLMPILICSAQNRAEIKGSGVSKTETRPVSGFTSISLTGVGKVTVRQTGRESLTVNAEDNILPVLETRVTNHTLALGIANHTNIHPTKPIEFIVEVKSLEGLTVAGAGTMEAKGIEGKHLAVTISGVGKVTTEGSADEQNVNVAGTGSYKGEDFKTRRATVSNGGVGHVVVNVSQNLTATVSGVGTVEYIGSPQVTKSVSGLGKIKPH